MSRLARLFRREARPAPTAQVEGRQVAYLTAGSDLRAQLGLWQPDGAVSVTVETALGVPAIWAAVNFRAGTLAALPLHVYRRERDGTVSRANSPLNRLLHDAPSEAMGAFDFFKFLFEQMFTEGRGIAFIERSPAGQVIGLHPLEMGSVTIRREAGRITYELREGGRIRVYEAGEVLDFVLMRRPDGIGHRSPVYTNRDAIGHAIATTRYASKMFANGGVPPFAVTGNFASPGAMSRASEDISETIRQASKDARQALVLPAGLEIKSIGSDAEKLQLIEAQRFVVEQIARIWGLPPVFLQDLTHGTFTNTEQQDLQLVKHRIAQDVRQIESEINLKLFAASSRNLVRFNVDGLLRGDFTSRMTGHAQAIQNGLRTPNEARELENLPPMAGGERLYVQGATVPLTQAAAPGALGATNGDGNGDGGGEGGGPGNGGDDAEE